MSKTTKFSETFCKSVDLLEKTKVDYLLIGGVAVGVWGEPRVTKDIDFIIFVKGKDIEKLITKANSLNLKFKPAKHPQFPKTFVYKLCYGAFYADFMIASTELEKSALDRKVKVSIFGKDVYVPSKEDLILLKIIPGRGQDIVDAEKIAIRYKGKLDEKYLLNWAMRLSDEAQDMRIYKEVKRLLTL